MPKHIYPTEDFGKQQRGVFSTGKILDSATPANQIVQATLSLLYNTSPLFVNYDKTGRFLSQYFPDLSINPNLYLDAEKVKQVKEWTRQNAPLTKKEAEERILSVCAEFLPDDSPAFDESKEKIVALLDTRYQSSKGYITGKEVANRRNSQKR